MSAPDPRKRLRGAQSRVAGEYFERYILAACEWYRSRGEADIDKAHEPMKPLRAPNERGQFLACYTKPAQPDFDGTLAGGRSIKFEAKHTDDSRIERSRLTDRQMEKLESHHRLGAIAFVLVSFSLQEFARIPWSVWRDMAKIYGRKYITREEAREYAVPCVAGTIKLLEGIETSEQTESCETCRLRGDCTKEVGIYIGDPPENGLAKYGSMEVSHCSGYEKEETP